MKVSSQVVDFSNNFLLQRKFRIEKITVTPPTCDCDEPLKMKTLLFLYRTVIVHNTFYHRVVEIIEERILRDQG